jgi:hypothetical protein
MIPVWEQSLDRKTGALYLAGLSMLWTGSRKVSCPGRLGLLRRYFVTPT